MYIFYLNLYDSELSIQKNEVRDNSQLIVQG